MFEVFAQNEATAARRRVYFQAVDATDGITPETGLTGAGRVSKNGGATAASTNTITEIDAVNMPGRYYLELTAAELDTLGVVVVRYKNAACAEVVAQATVVPYDPYVAGLTAAQVATEVLVTQTKAELAALPGTGAVNLFDMVRYLYQRFRHKTTATATEQKMFKADGATVLSTEGLADDATTFTKGAGA